MRHLIAGVLLVIATGWGCVAQTGIATASGEAERFAFELAHARADKRGEMLAAHPELLTVELRRQLIQHGNLRFASTQYAHSITSTAAWLHFKLNKTMRPLYRVLRRR